MSIPSWPSTLSQRLLLEGYKETIADLIDRTEMEVGPAKQARRGTANVRPITGYQNLNNVELAAFLDFYNTTLLNGSLRFSWVEPRDGATYVEMRFTSVPTFEPLSSNLFKVEMNLEIMP